MSSPFVVGKEAAAAQGSGHLPQGSTSSHSLSAPPPPAAVPGAAAAAASSSPTMSAAATAPLPSIPSPPYVVEQLLRENTTLKSLLQLSDEQRVVQEVLREQLRLFFDSAAEHELTSEQVLNDGQLLGQQQQQQGAYDEDGGAHNAFDANDVGFDITPASFLSGAVSEALRRMRDEKEQAEEALAHLQSDTVAPMHARLEAMEVEKRQLAARVAELEMSMASTPAPPLVAELRQLRETETLLRKQLHDGQLGAIGAVNTFRAAAEGELRAATELPKRLTEMEALREEVGCCRSTLAAQRVLLEEMEQRHRVEREVADLHHRDETEMLRERVAHVEKQLSAAVAREEAVIAERVAMEAQWMGAQDTIRQLTQQHSEEQLALAQKRQRAEEDASSNPSSIRGELTKFWYEGRDRIRVLERQVQTLHTTEAHLRVSQGRVAQLEQRKATLVGSLASLATEVDRRRDEEKRLRAHCAGLEAERDRLLTCVAMTVGPQLSESELRDCCSMIREAATRMAAASATVVADPQAIEEALLRAQKLKSEVAQLQRQKDQLQRFLDLRKDRVRALMEEEALLLRDRVSHGGSNHGTSTSRATTASPTGADTTFSLPQFLESVHRGADDVFLRNEESAARAAGATTKKVVARNHTASGTAGGADLHGGGRESSVTPHRDSFVALHRQFTQSQERLLASHRDLLEARNENKRLQTELESTREEHRIASAAQEEARAAVEAANTALAQRTTSLANELQQLRQHYASAVAVSHRALEGLSHTLDLYHQSEQHATALREMVQQERRDMSDLLRREAASWGSATETGGDRVDATAAQHAAAAERIVEALRDLEVYITEAVAQTTLQATQEQTMYVGRLVQAIQKQEERVRAAKSAFETSVQAQASTLAERISAAQRQWESMWRAKYQAIEAERTQSVMHQHASVVVQRALEQAVMTPTPSVPVPPVSPEDGAASVPPSSLMESTTHMAETLRAISSFITQARQRQAAQEQQQQLQLRREQEQAALAAAVSVPESPSPEQEVPSTGVVHTGEGSASAVSPTGPPSHEAPPPLTAPMPSIAIAAPASTYRPQEGPSAPDTDNEQAKSSDVVPSGTAALSSPSTGAPRDDATAPVMPAPSPKGEEVGYDEDEEAQRGHGQPMVTPALAASVREAQDAMRLPSSIQQESFDPVTSAEAGAGPPPVDTAASAVQDLHTNEEDTSAASAPTQE